MLRRNTYLWSVIVIGAIVTTIGGTGIFAVFTDRATQGPNTVESGPQPKAADLQVSQFIAGACTAFQDDLTTAIWSVTNAQPGQPGHMREFCLRNVGSATLALGLTALDFAQSDPQCTGDEEHVDPACGGGAGQGQLANLLEVEYLVDSDCDSSYGEVGEISGTHGLFTLGSNTVVLTPINHLHPDSTTCLGLVINYPSTTSLTDVQAAQSDRVSWKFAFDASAIE